VSALTRVESLNDLHSIRRNSNKVKLRGRVVDSLWSAGTLARLSKYRRECEGRLSEAPCRYCGYKYTREGQKHRQSQDKPERAGKRRPFIGQSRLKFTQEPKRLYRRAIWIGCKARIGLTTTNVWYVKCENKQ
jgi:hypothetical protein